MHSGKQLTKRLFFYFLYANFYLMGVN